MKYYISLLDYGLLPFYLAIVFAFAFGIRNKYYPPGHPWRQYFIPAITFKVLGSLAISLLYQYYYGGGDTAEYFKQARTINSSFFESPTKWMNLMLHVPKWYDGEYYMYIASKLNPERLYWYDSPPEFMIIRILAIISFLSFNTYLPASVLLGALSFSGVWALFRILASFYPHLTRNIAIAILFIPSLALWCSGIFKDTICLAGIGWLTFAALRMLVYRDFSVGNIALGIVSFYLISVIKIYILMAFIPALVLWVLFIYLRNIESGFLRFIVMVPVMVGALFGFRYASNKLSESLGKYSVENIATTAQVTREWINETSNEESINYDIGAMDPSYMGMVKKLPRAINVTLFRPYIWETKKAIQLVTALEAAAFLLLTLKVLLSVGIGGVWRAINSDPTLQFCLIFTLIFAFAVGISSSNFGTLSRYRTPCLPFYALSLILIYYRYNSPEEKDLFSFRR
ncbi:MAG: hypothetical protein EOP49_07070 [Sphingobacteriales bacterium]|nr:MAG: hypothetical protein EOP49_07070 [Sphingobacteriales bacterium]